MVCEVARELPARVATELVGVVVFELDPLLLMLATRCAVEGGIAFICIGGSVVDVGLDFLGSVADERVLPRFRPINAEIRLSLRSLSSFFLSFSAFSRAFSCSLMDFLFSRSLVLSALSECSALWRLLRELDPRSRLGNPRERTEAFLCADEELLPGVVGDISPGSVGGDIVLFTRRREADAFICVGEVDLTIPPPMSDSTPAGREVDDDRLEKNGMDDGVRRCLVDPPRLKLDVGLIASIRLGVS